MYDDYERLLAKVAALYYVDDVPQNVIAQQLGLSKSKVCRMLAEAKRRGIVRATVYTTHEYSDLEREFEKRYNLREAIIVSSDTDPMAEIGTAGAEYLRRVVREGDIIGVSWGRTLLSVAEKLSPLRVDNVSVVQLVGGLDTQMNQLQSSKLAMQFAMACGCTAQLLYCPAKAPTQEVMSGLMLDPVINRVFQMGRRATIALVGIGAMVASGELFRNGYIPYETLHNLKEGGAVGDVCMRFYDENGQETANTLGPLTMSIPLEDLKKIPNVVCLAAGKEKGDAILGALKGGIAKTFITDKATADFIMTLDR